MPTPRTKLRGWFHACFVPFVLASDIVLLCLAPGMRKLAVVVFMVCSTLLFSMSGVYHLFNWGEGVKNVLRRFDHMNIFLIIAGTYTPIAVSSLPLSFDFPWYQSGLTMLIIIWSLTVVGLILNLIWITAPRVIITTVYVVLGLSSLIWLPAVAQFGGDDSVTIVTLIASGGACYIIGAIFYALKNPLRYAKVFGFHELFHCLTLAAFSCHAVAIYFAVLSG